MRLFNYLFLVCMVFNFSVTNYKTNYSQVSRVIYKKSVYEEKDLREVNNPNIRSQLKEMQEISKMLEYQLLFNNNESTFQLIDNLNIKENSPILILAKGFKQIFYRNNRTKNKLVYSESTGKGFNVLKKYDEYKWTVTKETKMIGDYLCYKATTYYYEINPVTSEKKEFNPVVWFTLDIPVSFGPIGLDGLPGLVLEATINGQTYYYASSIQLNWSNDNKHEISRPRGEEISEIKYNKILAKAFDRN